MLSFHRFIHIEHERKCCLSTGFRTVHQFFPFVFYGRDVEYDPNQLCIIHLMFITNHLPCSTQSYGGDIANVPIPPYVYQEPIHHILPVIYGGDVKNVSIPAVCCPHFVHYDRYLSLCKHFLSAVFPHKLIVN